MKERMKCLSHHIQVVSLGLVLLFLLSPSYVYAGCEEQVSEKFTLQTIHTNHSIYNRRDIINYINSCLPELAERYVELSHRDILAKDNIAENRRNIRTIIHNLELGHYTSRVTNETHDYDQLILIKNWADTIRANWQRDSDVQSWQQDPSSPERDVEEFANLCLKVSDLAEIDPVYQQPSSEGSTTPNAIACGGCEANALVCAKACAEGHEDSCYTLQNDPNRTQGVFGDLAQAARACAADENDPACNTPGLNETPADICRDGVATHTPDASPDSPETPVSPTGETDPATDPPGDEDDVSTASVPPTGGNGDPNSDGNGNEDTDATQTQEDLEDTADRLAQQMFGSGQMQNFQRGNPSGSIEAPDVSMEGQSVSSASFDSVSDGRGVSAPRLNPNLPLAGMPVGSPPGRPGGTAKQGGRPAGGAGGGASGGGGGVGSGGGGGGGAPAKGGNRGGVRVNQRLKAIADGLGTNRFLSADGAKGGANNAPQEIERRISPRLKKQIAKNQEKANERALNSALQRNLNNAAQRKAVFMKASYFPEKTEIYMNLQQNSDYLNENGL